MAAVSVITAGKHGSTAEIGAALAARLEAGGHEAESCSAEGLEGIEAGTAVVLGSAIYMGRWHRPAVRLAAQLGDGEQGALFWLFSVGPIGDPPEPPTPPLEELVSPAAAANAAGYRTFSGRLDRASLGRVERLAVKAQGADDGDYRDWGAVEAWADEIGAALVEAAGV